MKIKYTPGTDNGLVGKTYTVEIVSMEIIEATHINYPLLRQVKIKYDDGRTEWVSGIKLFNSTDNTQRALVKRVV